ncbi:hypothetical protein KP509_13G040900 [Ceratopteris richardii]|nr:hypothetical protein KP509_13G040900 [Ceratopteris richardii]
MNDIPYGDYFCVKGWWDVSPLMERAVPHCAVRVFVDVVFSKKTVWKGKIEQGTYDECRDVYATWLAEAHQLLKEKGMINEQPLRDCAKQQKLKRKHDVNSLQILGNKKVSKNMGNISVAQVCAPEGQSQQPVQALISPARTGLAYLSQQLSPTALNSISQVKMLVVICVLLLFFLIHTGIIIALSRTQKIQYLPFDQQKCVDYHGSLGSHQRGQDTLWLEQSTRILWEEVNIAEARLKTMLQTVEVLKASLNLAERISSKELQSAD